MGEWMADRTDESSCSARLGGDLKIGFMDSERKKKKKGGGEGVERSGGVKKIWWSKDETETQRNRELRKRKEKEKKKDGKRFSLFWHKKKYARSAS